MADAFHWAAQRNAMKYLKRWAIVVAAISGLGFGSYAIGHSGGTDQYGCHVDHSNGVRHCHNPK